MGKVVRIYRRRSISRARLAALRAHKMFVYFAGITVLVAVGSAITYAAICMARAIIVALVAG